MISAVRDTWVFNNGLKLTYLTKNFAIMSNNEINKEICRSTWGGIPMRDGKPDKEFILNSWLYKKNCEAIRPDQYYCPNCKQEGLVEIPYESIHINKEFPVAWVSKDGVEYPYFNSNYKLEGKRYANVEKACMHNGELVLPLPKEGYPYTMKYKQL